MPKNKLQDLRDHLFAQLEALRDATGEQLTKEIERSKAVVQVSEAITETAKVEVHFAEAIGAEVANDFFEGRPKALPNGVPKREM